MTLGESVVLMQTPPPYQAVATRKSRILVIDGARWLSEVQSIREMSWEVLKHMAQRRLNAMHMLAASSRRTDLSRVAGYIMEFRPKLKSESFSFELPARKLDIAANLGMSNASFSRALQRLKKAEYVHVNGAFIHVVQAFLLDQVAQTA
jgi:CRP-like cAMP-binding protein